MKLGTKLGAVALLAVATTYCLMQADRSTRSTPAAPKALPMVGKRPEPEVATTSQRTLPAAGSVLSHQKVTGWGPQFWQSHNYFDFVAAAARAASNGDARAEFYIGKALLECALTTRLYHGHRDPEGEFAQQQIQSAPQPQWYRDSQARQFERCKGLIDRDPFAELPQRTGGYGYKYWLDRAYQNGDPVAALDKTPERLATATVKTGSDRDSAIDEVQATIDTAVSSADPDALFRVGSLLTDPRYSADPLNGIAISLAACDLGYDCSSNNPQNLFSACKGSGNCPSDADFSYYAQQQVGAERFAQAYAKEQEFKQALSTMDANALRAFLRIKR